MTSAPAPTAAATGGGVPSSVAATPVSNAALAPDAWTSREVAGPLPVTDAQGSVWLPATGITGGSAQSTTGGIGDTATDALYQHSVRGLTSWQVTVPRPGRYAVDLLVADTTDEDPGSDVFDVDGDGGDQTVALAAGLDINSIVGGYHAYHVTGLVPVSGTTLTLQFTKHKGDTIANGLKVTSDGADVALSPTLDETFDGAAGTRPDPSVWGYQQGTGWEGDDGLENYTDSAANSSLDGKGQLVITARRTGGSGASSTWDSAELRSAGKFSFGYGDVSATMQVPKGSGLWPAFWAKGVDEATVDWPRCGEIDVMEAFRGLKDDVSGHVHSLGSKSDPSANYKNEHEASLGTDQDIGVDPSLAFHTYSVDYMPGAVTFFVDGVPYFTAAPEDLSAGEQWPFTGKKMYLLLDLAVGDNDYTGVPNASTPDVAKLIVDRVTVTQ